MLGGRGGREGRRSLTGFVLINHLPTPRLHTQGGLTMPLQVLTITKRKIRKLVYREMKDMDFFSFFFLQMFQREGPSDKSGLSGSGYYSNETLKKLTTQPLSLTRLILLTLPPTLSACCAIIARHFNKASQWSAGLRLCHFCSLRWQETSHYGRERRRLGKSRLTSESVTAIDSLLNNSAPK